MGWDLFFDVGGCSLKLGFKPDPFFGDPAIVCGDGGIDRLEMSALPALGLFVVNLPIRRMLQHCAEVVEMPASVSVLQQEIAIGIGYRA